VDACQSFGFGWDFCVHSITDFCSCSSDYLESFLDADNFGCDFCLLCSAQIKKA